MSRPSTAPVVAELGRPETAEETAARKAETSRNHRARQTVNNLVYSLLATVALVVVIVLMVPRGTPAVHTNVDYTSIASQGQGSEPDALATPKLPSGWTSNSAQLKAGTRGAVDSWYIGLITPSQQYIGFTQGFDANDTWTEDLLQNTTGTGTSTIDGVRWTVYDNRTTSRDVGNARYALTTTAGRSTYVLLGTAKTSEFETVARALVPSIQKSETKRGS